MCIYIYIYMYIHIYVYTHAYCLSPFLCIKCIFHDCQFAHFAASRSYRFSLLHVLTNHKHINILKHNQK